MENFNEKAMAITIQGEGGKIVMDERKVTPNALH